MDTNELTNLVLKEKTFNFTYNQKNYYMYIADRLTTKDVVLMKKGDDSDMLIEFNDIATWNEELKIDAFNKAKNILMNLIK